MLGGVFDEEHELSDEHRELGAVALLDDDAVLHGVQPVLVPAVVYPSVVLHLEGRLTGRVVLNVHGAYLRKLPFNPSKYITLIRINVK